MATQTWNQVGPLIAGAAFTTAPPYNFLETRPPQSQVAAVAESISVDTPYPGAPFVVDTGDTIFNAVIDPLMWWGYNAGAQGVPILPAEASVYWMIEANYDDTVRQNVETHFSLYSTAGVNKRPFGITVDRDNPDNYCAMAIAISALQGFAITKISDGSELVGVGGGGIMTFHPAGAAINFLGANPYIQSVTASPLTLVAVGGVATTGPVGFNGSPPLAPPVLATGALHTVDDVITMLQNYGLCTQV